MNKKDLFIYTILIILFIISLSSNAQIFNIPINDLLIYITIIILVIDGIMNIKSKKNKSWINLIISLGLIIMLFKKYK